MENPRRLALSSLVKAEQMSSYSNIEVNSVISRSDISKLDASLYTALYLGVTERLITLDYIISQCSEKSISELDSETKNALRLGLYQLLYMDKIPDYSAVSETVSICPKRSKGYVNACLRSFLRKNKQYDLPENEWEALSITTSIPADILSIFKASYGDECAKEIALAIKPKKGVTARINTLKVSASEFKRIIVSRGIKHTVSAISNEILILDTPISEIIDLIDKGFCFIQDVASFTCTKIFAPSSSSLMLDACSCPGGKSFSCAIDMKNSGKIVSCDLHKNKLSLVKSGADRLGISIIEVQEQDAKAPREDFLDAFDFVLCDVPCSGLGVIAKKPDIKYKSVDQILNLPTIQSQILENCSKYVKVGGCIVYSTCTLNAQENESVVSAFLASNDSFESVDFEIDKIHSQNGMYTFMPHITDTDGFFVAKMKRVK